MKKLIKKLLTVAAAALFGATAQADESTILGTIKDLPIGDTREIVVNVDGKKADDWYVQSAPAFVTTKVTKNFDRTCTVAITAIDESVDALSYITVWRTVDTSSEPVGKIAVSAKASETIGLLSVVNVETKGPARGFYIDSKPGDFKFEAEDNGQAGFCETELKASVRDSSKTLLTIRAKEFSAHSQRLLTDNPTYYVMKKGWFNSTYKANTIVVRTTAEQAKMRLTLNEQSVYPAHSEKARQWRWSSSLLTADGVKLFKDANCSDAIPMSCKTTEGKWNDIYARIEASSYIPGKSHVNLNMIDAEVEVQGVDIDIDIYRPVVKNETVCRLYDDTKAYIPLTWGPGASEFLKFSDATNSLWRISSEDGKIASADRIVVHPTMLGSVAALEVTAKELGATTLYATDGAYEFMINLNVNSAIVKVIETPVEGVTTKAFYMGEEKELPFEAVTNTPVQFVYTIQDAENYAFADGSVCRTQTVFCVNNPTTDSDAPAACKLPTVTTVKLTNGEKYPYDRGWRFEMDEAGEGQYSAFGDWDAEFYISCDRAIEDKTILFATIQPVEDDQGVVKDEWVGSEMPELAKDEEIGYFERFLGTTSTYAELCDNLGELSCAVRNHSAANAGLTVTVVLRLTKEIDGQKRCICVPICPIKWLVHHLHRVARPCCHPWVCNHKPAADGKLDANCKPTSRSMELAEVEMELPAPQINLSYHNKTKADFVHLYDFNKGDDDETGAYWEPKFTTGYGNFFVAPTNCTDSKVFGLTTEVMPTANNIRASNLSIDTSDEMDAETKHLTGEEDHIYDYGFMATKRAVLDAGQTTTIQAFSQYQNDWTVYTVNTDLVSVAHTNFDANTISITVKGEHGGWAKIIAFNTNKVFCASCKRCGPCGKKHCHFCKGERHEKRHCEPFLLHPPCVRPFFHHGWLPCHICAPCTLCTPCTICKVAPCTHRICGHHNCPHGFFRVPCCTHVHHCGTPYCPKPEPQCEPEPEPEPEPECTCYTAGAHYEFWVKVNPPVYNIGLYHDKGASGECDQNTCYTEGAGYDMTTLKPDKQRPGWTFSGWYDNANLDGDPVLAVGEEERGDKVFWAKWISDADVLYTFKPAVAEHMYVMNVTTGAGWKVEGPEYQVRPNAKVTVQYGTDEGYWFADTHETNKASTVEVTADPTKDANPNLQVVPGLNVNMTEVSETELGTLGVDAAWKILTSDKPGETVFDNWLVDVYLSFDKKVEANTVSCIFASSTAAKVNPTNLLETAAGETYAYVFNGFGARPRYSDWINVGDMPLVVGISNNDPANNGTVASFVMKMHKPNTTETVVVTNWTYTLYTEVVAPKVAPTQDEGEETVQPTIEQNTSGEWEVKVPENRFGKKMCPVLNFLSCSRKARICVPAHQCNVIYGLHKLATISLKNHLGHVIDSKYVKGWQPDGSFSTELTAEAKKTVVTDLGTTEVDGKLKFKFETKPGLVYNVVGSASLSAINSDKPDFDSGDREGDGGTLELDVTAKAKGQQQFFYKVTVSK